MRYRNGFTLTEVLIVVAIVGLLISIAIPAVQAVRERSRQTSCQHNLRQFGVAFQSFSASNSEQYPSGLTLKIKGPVIPNLDLQAHSYVAYLLPYFETDTAARDYDLDSNFSAPENSTSVSAALGIGICPSSPARPASPAFEFVPSATIPGLAHSNKIVSGIIAQLDAKYKTTFNGGLIDYGPIAWIDTSVVRDFGMKPVTDWGMGIEGMFPYPLGTDYKVLLADLAKAVVTGSSLTVSKPRKAADLRDGPSHTIMLIEAAGRPERWETGKHTGRGEPVEGGAWADFRNIMRIYGAAGDSKCLLSCNNRESVYSFHPGIVNVLYADGHVDSLSTSTDGKVFIALASIDGRDNVGSGSE
jgi:prepilin-type N-terminal cleavage/methylation domain-containing protein/prepilin-type processing-associated H-X9-DG protein